MKNFKIKDYFSKNLYLESLNQTKIAGLFIILATVVFCGIYPFIELVVYLQGRVQVVQVLGVFQINIVLILLMYVIPVFLAFECFGFLNKRTACDLYHSLPVKRQTMFCSFALAGLSWLAVALVLGGLAPILIFSIMPNIYIPVAGCFNLILTVLVGGLLIYTAMLLGISLSGNKLTQIMLAVLIVIIPQLTQTTILSQIDSLTNYTTLSTFTVNVPLLLAQSVIGSQDYNTVFSAGCIIFTLVMALILAILACVAFVNRKSELAGNNAPNKVAQHIYRLCLMAPFAIIFTNYIMEASLDMLSILISVFVVSVVFYVGYEVATTRSRKNIIKSLPYYSVVVVATFALLLVIYLGSLVCAIPSPTAEKINYVTFSNSQGVTSTTDSYMQALSSHKVYDEEIIQIVSDGLDLAIETNGMQSVMSVYSNSSEKYTREYVTINTGIFNITRKIIISQEDSLVIEEYFANQTDINECLLEIPEKEDILKLAVYGVGISEYNFDGSELLDIFYEEFNQLSKEDKYALIVGTYSTSDITPVFAAVDTTYVNDSMSVRINMTTLNKYESELTTIYIDQRLPKTYQYLLEYSYENENLNPKYYISEIENTQEYVDSADQIYFSVDIAGIDGTAIWLTTAIYENSAITTEDLMSALDKTKEILENQTEIDYSDLYFMNITVELWDSDYYESAYYEDYGYSDSMTYDYSGSINLQLLVSLENEDIEYFQTLQKKILS